MTAHSLGRALIGVLGVYFLILGVQSLVEFIFGPLRLMNTTAPFLRIGAYASTLAFMSYRLFVGIALIALRYRLARLLFGEDEGITIVAPTRAVIALLLLVLGISDLIGSLLRILYFVGWGPTAYGFPFHFVEYPIHELAQDLVQGLIGLILIFGCGRMSGWLERRVRYA